MQTKLAGRLPLKDMIAGVIQESRMKVAAAEEKDEKVKKLVAYEKKEHGGKVPSVKEEEKEKEEETEKKSSVVDFFDSEEVEKLASALDYAGEMLKEADKVDIGGESKQGGEVLAVMAPVKGTQPYKHDSSKSHNVPMSTGMQADPSQGKAATQVPNDHAKAPGGGGTQKVSSVDEALSKIADAASTMKGALSTITKHPHLTGAVAGGVNGAATGAVAGAAGAEKGKRWSGAGKGAVAGGVLGGVGGAISKHPYAAAKEIDSVLKHASANVSYILNKMAESAQGGMTLDSKSGEGPKPESSAKGGNDARGPLESNQAAISMKKIDGKKPQKRMLSEILTEPAFSKAHDSKVSENLQNASKGGVKIAGIKAHLQKIAAEGCTCDDKGDCKYCKMKAAMSKKKDVSEGKSSPPGMSGSAS